MQKFNFNLSVSAPGAEEAALKVQAAAVLISKLKTAELQKLADIVKNDPLKTAIARKALGL